MIISLDIQENHTGKLCKVESLSADKGGAAICTHTIIVL